MKQCCKPRLSHCLKVWNVAQDSQSIFVLKVLGNFLDELASAFAPKAFLLRLLDEGSTHPLVCMVDALFLFNGGVPIWLHLNNGVVGLAVTVCQEASVAQSFLFTSRPQTLCHFNLHGIRGTSEVDTTVYMVFLPFENAALSFPNTVAFHVQAPQYLLRTSVYKTCQDISHSTKAII